MRLFRGRRAKEQEVAQRAADNIMRETGGEYRAGSGAVDLTMGGHPALAIVTDDRILWALLAEPDIVMQMKFPLITLVEQEEDTIRLMESDPEYARSLDDPSNPHGETDLFIQISSAEFMDWLHRGLFKLSPVYADRRAHVQTLKDRQGVPVDSWADCPFCGSSLTSRLPGAVSCTDCKRCFCDPDLEPVISEDPATYGHVVGTKPWRPLLETFLPAQGKTTTWPYRPAEMSIGPLVVLDMQTVELMELL